MPEPVCLIKCLSCKQQFPSPLQFSTARTFFTSTLMGSSISCPNCGNMTRCNRENMYFNDREGGIQHGDQIVPMG